MITIGLTGGIGSGKSEAADVLHSLGAVVLNADQIGHEAYAPGTDGFKRVVEAFGASIVRENGEIDRRKLGALVFENDEKRAQLEAIVWPLIGDRLQKRINETRARGTVAVVVEAAVLLEAGWHRLVDHIWVVDAPDEIVVERVKSARGLTDDEVRQRMRAQMTSTERRRRATLLVWNGGDLESFKKNVRDAWESIAGRTERG